jgi:hypothetical protein
MNDDDQYVLDTIKLWVWSGFYSPDEVQEMIEDILEDGCDEVMLRAAIAPEFARKREAEQAWPAITDCDRLDVAFWRLHEAGVCAIENAGYTLSDGYTEVSEAVAQAPPGHYHGYCFYHGQDVERAVQGQGLMLAFGDLKDRKDEGVAVGHAVVKALAAAGLKAEWSGELGQRIGLPDIDWRRRAPPNVTEDMLGKI